MNVDDVSIWVIDSSALIDMKSVVPVSHQWAAFKHLEEMVAQGSLALPRHMINEVVAAMHPDMPGAWAAGMRGFKQHPPEAGFDYLQRVMDVAGDVVDVNKAGEDADPWVLALALQIKESVLFEVCVVTEDTVDRHRISMVTACDRLELRWCTLRDFLGRYGIKMRAKGSE